MMKSRPKTKAILSLPLAQRLMAKGYTVITAQPSRNRPGKLAFIFENSKELDDEITRYSREGRTSD